MACAYHGQKADCGPECAGFLYPNPDAGVDAVGPDPADIAGELTQAFDAWWARTYADREQSSAAAEFAESAMARLPR